VYIGELLPERGVHSAVRAVSTYDGDARLTLAGPVADGLAGELRALDTHDRLSLPGLVDRATVHELLTGATAGLVLLEPVPAYDDATATKLFEYLSAGLPMIVSSTTAHRRFANKHGCAVVTDYDDDHQLREAMAAVAEPERWRQLHEAAESATMPTWDADGAPALLGLYRRVVDD
jgi:glycosyltransferase involved in cell wall biosynthesis